MRRSPRRKTVAVAVDPVEGVLLTAPEGVPLERLDAIVRDKARWIRARLRLVDQVEPTAAAREFVSGECFAYLGRRHRLLVRERGQAEGGEVKLDHGRFVVEVAQGLDARARAAAVKAALEGWYRGRARARLEERVSHWAEVVGVEAAGVLIREQSKRWASCDAQGVLRFNWRIIQAPMGQVDYIVAHELVHLIHADHTAAFWARLGVAMPDYEARKEALRRLGPQLWWS
ncbi:M48 family metallopeptidase [Pseudenhygromyxa sp. WMMC2535]|uniref:YgjP-like metallopeptidase domain-containing protein n=1 Tax=Pseudenhygromyxa sp. WMMC2535 TaxID=2712867 RepID=UPI00159574E6|nr:M48 family metallopeptidase [Pseudenhygromyxa sp. WMMC2535]